MSRPKTPEVMVACDGSCLRNPGGPTGWAWVASDGRWAAGCQPTGTNQVGELWGLLTVLRDFPTEPLAIQIDSEYAMKVATVWARSWARNGWRTRDGKKVANLALVVSIHRQMTIREAPVRFIKVPGHDPANRYPLNTAADKRARAAATYAQQHDEARDFKGIDKNVIMVDPPRPHERREMPKPGLVICESCDRPINVMGECGCSS